MDLLFETSPDFLFIYLFILGEGGGGGGGTKLQCIYYLVTYTDLLATEGISAFQTSLLFF